ncbi:MAG: nucleotide pyrophosphohydrolase [Candidatus Abawacabacteria bacterium]|nr:nucleotide pyrophosphohydrolase [Candidatus Abawacabacteria bacterium]
MEFSQLQNRAIAVMNQYIQLNQQVGRPAWTAAEYLQAFVGDVGDLTKLIMAKNNFRTIPDYEEKLGHELSDCLWAICVLAKQLNIDLEIEFQKTMEQIEKKITAQA